MYKFRDDIILEEICGAYLLVALRSAWDKYPFAIRISGSSALIWKCVRDGISKNSIIERLQHEYGYSHERAEKVYRQFIEYCKKKEYFV